MTGKQEAGNQKSGVIISSEFLLPTPDRSVIKFFLIHLNSEKQVNYSGN